MEFKLAALAGSGPALLAGLLETLRATLVVLGLGLGLGALACLGRMSKATLPRMLARLYILVFRVTPELVLIFWAYYCLPIFFGATLSGFVSGCVSLGLVAGAYLAEIFRAGIEGVPPGQSEAARALGLRPFAVWRHVVGPQSLRLIVPPFMNYLTTLLKNTTLLAAVAVGELSFQAFRLGAQTYRYFEFLTAIALLFASILVPIGLLSRLYEARVARKYLH